jgi:hypothetical protein
MQSGSLDETDKAVAIAANVRLEPGDDLEARPLKTVRLLPAHAVVIFVTFSPRGDPAKDSGHPVREPPLRLDDAEQLRAWYQVARYRLRAGIGGYNVDALVYFGENAPSTRAFAAAQSQLNRLVVGSERVTIAVRPATLRGRQVLNVFGSIDSDRAGEDVAIQAKDCGKDSFRVADGAITREGGAWSADFIPAITTTLRAVWNETVSAQITVRQRITVYLRRQVHGRGFVVGVDGKESFWRKRILIQRFDRRLGTWSTVKSVVLTETGFGDSRLGTHSTLAEFKARTPKGSLLRAVFPLSQARPCYLQGVSLTLRT